MRVWWEIGRLRICSLLQTSSQALRCGEKKSNTISARPRTNYRERPGHVSAIHLSIPFLCFRRMLATLTWSWSWALTWAILRSSRNSLIALLSISRPQAAILRTRYVRMGFAFVHAPFKPNKCFQFEHTARGKRFQKSLSFVHTVDKKKIVLLAYYSREGA